MFFMQMVGSIDPKLSMSALLYAKIPFVGKITLANLKGSLDAGVTQNINIILAKGTVTFTTQQSLPGRHDLYTSISLDVKFVKSISAGTVKLFTLP